MKVTTYIYIVAANQPDFSFQIKNPTRHQKFLLKLLNNMTFLYDSISKEKFCDPFRNINRFTNGQKEKRKETEYSILF